jgi:hypothetical protein
MTLSAMRSTWSSAWLTATVVRPSCLFNSPIRSSIRWRAAWSRALVGFTMLETVREYALERLEESGELERLHRRHSSYFLELA